MGNKAGEDGKPREDMLINRLLLLANGAVSLTMNSLRH